MNQAALNGIIRRFRDKENTSLEPEEYTLDNIEKKAS